MRFVCLDLGGSYARHAGLIAGGGDGGNEVVDVDRCRRPHVGLLGGEVDRGLDAVEPVQPSLDPRRAGSTRHPFDLQIDVEAAIVGDPGCTSHAANYTH